MKVQNAMGLRGCSDSLGLGDWSVLCGRGSILTGCKSDENLDGQRGQWPF